MSSISKRVRGRADSWRALYRTAEGRQRNKTFGQKVDAEQFLTTIEASKLAGSFVDPHRTRVTVGDLAEQWIESKGNLGESTQGEVPERAKRRAEAGVSGLTPHWLRHTAASLAVLAGANVKAVQRMLGHASAAITLDVYAYLFPDDLQAVGTAHSALRHRTDVAPVLPEPVENAGAGTG